MDKIVAALAVGADELLPSLLAQLNGLLQHKPNGDLFLDSLFLRQDSYFSVLMQRMMVVCSSKNEVLEAVLSASIQKGSTLHTLQIIQVWNQNTTTMRIGGARLTKLIGLAIREGDVKVLKIILKFFCRVSVPSRSIISQENFKPACNAGQVDIKLALLQEGGLSCNKVWATATPLIYAVRSGHLPVVQSVLQQRAKVNLKSERAQRSPMQVAIQLDLREITKELLEYGADIPKVAPRSLAMTSILAEARDK
jgi:hypothetical protein